MLGDKLKSYSVHVELRFKKVLSPYLVYLTLLQFDRGGGNNFGGNDDSEGWGTDSAVPDSGGDDWAPNAVTTGGDESWD